MKKIILALLTAFSCTAAFAQDNPPPMPPPPVPVSGFNMRWSETLHPFGEIPQGKPVTCDFILYNTGRTGITMKVTPQPACSCLKIDYPKGAILPGKSGVIHVTFDAAVSGPFQKDLVVYLLGTNKPYTLRMAGLVTPRP